MLLLVLAIVWGGLLVSWLRSRSAGTFSDSVGTFRRHLTVLERTTPTSVRPANRLRDGYPARQRPIAPYSARYGAAPARGVMVPARPGPQRTTTTTTSALRRRRTQKRRRDVLFALLAGTAGSLVLALIPGLSIMWSVQVLFDLGLAGYVALLVRMRNLAAERELKLRFIPGNRPAAAGRRTYDLGSGPYGELELRRIAN